MNQLGFIKVSRKAFRDAWWIEPREFSRFEAWLDCIQMAQWKPGTVEGIRLERGEFFASMRGLANRWQWGLQRVRTFVSATQQATRLKTQRETQQGNVYLIVNYDSYQGASNESNTADNTIKSTPASTRKEEEQIKKNYIGSEFDEAWAIYPKRLGGNPKRRAEAAWSARIREGVDPAAMLDGVRRYAAYCVAERKAGTPYVQQAATFFGPGGSFEDEWSTGRAQSTGPILTAAGNPILSIHEFREQQQRELEEINQRRIARGEAPIAVA